MNGHESAGFSFAVGLGALVVSAPSVIRRASFEERHDTVV